MFYLVLLSMVTLADSITISTEFKTITEVFSNTCKLVVYLVYVVLPILLLTQLWLIHCIQKFAGLV
jgi:hypothetical protein